MELNQEEQVHLTLCTWIFVHSNGSSTLEVGVDCKADVKPSSTNHEGYRLLEMLFLVPFWPLVENTILLLSTERINLECNVEVSWYSWSWLVGFPILPIDCLQVAKILLINEALELMHPMCLTLPVNRCHLSPQLPFFSFDRIFKTQCISWSNF